MNVRYELSMYLVLIILIGVIGKGILGHLQSHHDTAHNTQTPRRTSTTRLDYLSNIISSAHMSFLVPNKMLLSIIFMSHSQIVELIDACHAAGVPFIIISAGFKEVVEGILDCFGVARSKYVVWSNEMLFENQKLIGVKRPILHM